MKIKNMSLGKLTVISLSALILILYSACDAYVGLGSGVDILPPKGEITYPDAGETPIRGSFIIKGTATDDETIKAVSVSFKDVDTGWHSQAYSASVTLVSAGSFLWTAEINNDFTGNTREGHPLVKEYPLPDGTYTAVVTLTDSNDKKTKLSREYTIDNTPPVFIVDRPSTVLSAENTSIADPYGAVFTVIGQAEDKNKIEDLTLKVENSTVEISKKFVGKNINEKMAEAAKDGSNTYTDVLYLYNQINTHNNSSPKIKTHLFLTDNARLYKGDSPEGTGNTSEWYYVRDQHIRSVLAQGYTADVINDYFAGKRGSAFSTKRSKRLLASLYDVNNAEGQTVKAILENSRILTNGTYAEKYSLFTLNPDKSPGFQVSNAANLPLEINSDTASRNPPHPSVRIFQDGVSPTLIVDLIGNKDRTPLVQNQTDYMTYRSSGIAINLYKCNDVFYTNDGAVKKLHLVPEVVPSFSFKFADLEADDLISQGTNPAVVTPSADKLTVSWKLPDNFGSGGYYLIRVEGTDTENNEFIAYNNNNSAGGVFVVNFKLIGDTPMIRPEAPSGYIGGDFVVQANVFNLPEPRTVRYKIVKASESNQIGAAESDPLLNPKTGFPTEYESALIPASSLSGDGRYIVHFWTKNDGNKEARAKEEFIKDTKAPVPEMTFPSPTEDQMGTVRIMGNISDDGAGVRFEGTKYIIGKTAEPGVDSPDWNLMDKSTPVSWEFMYNLDDFADSPAAHGRHISGSVYEIPVYILTEDKIGNKAVTTKKIRFDKEGAKPVMTVQSPKQDQMLGGAVQIFGTGTTRLGGPSKVGKVYIQFSKTGRFDSEADGTFGISGQGYDANWYQNNKGQAIAGTESGGSDWQITVNANGEFNNSSTSPSQQNRDVYFRVRAENKDHPHILGPWTRAVKITIDKAYPTVGSPEPLKIVSNDNSFSENYVQDMWITDGKKLTGSLYDEAGIKSLTLLSPELSGGVPYSLQRALAEGWIVEDTARSPNPPTGAKNYTLQIPLTIKDSIKRKGNLDIKIRIVENTPKELASETDLRVRFDVTKPAAAFGTWIVKSAYTSFSGGKFTVSPAPDAAKKERYRVLVDDRVYEIADISGTQVTLANAADLSGSFNYGITKRPLTIYNDDSDYQITGIATDTVTGVQKVTAELEVAGTRTSVEMTRDHLSNKISQERGGMVSFQGSLNTKLVKNGIGTLTITAKDERENTVSERITNVTVKNKPVEIKKIAFKTDLSGNDIYEPDEQFEIENFGSIDRLSRDFRGTADAASRFTFKNPTKSELAVTLTGGYGQTAAVSLHHIGIDGPVVKSGTVSIPSVLNSEYTLTLDLNGVLNIGDAVEKKLYLKVTDGSVNTPWYAEADINVGLDVVDEVAPKGFIMPFFYNSDKTVLTGEEVKLTSVKYEGGKPAGHIEISGINALTAGVPCVSGKVMLRGIAYDDVRLGTLTLSGAGINETAAFAAGRWTGAHLKVIKNKLSNTGHYVEWEYEWDTGFPAAGEGIRLTVKDAKTSPNTSSSVSSEPSEKQGLRPSDRTLTLASGDTAVKNQFIRLYRGDKSYLIQVEAVSSVQVGSEYRTRVRWEETSVPEAITTYKLYTDTSNHSDLTVNIVPYISSIENETGQGLNNTVIRGSDGSYSMNYSTAETMIVKGFNLQGALNTTAKIDNVAATVSHISAHQIRIKKDAVRSGELVVKVGTVESINDKVDITKPYNKEGSAANPSSNLWNARRKLVFWENKQVGTSKPSHTFYYPSMVMLGDTPLFAYCNNNDGFTWRTTNDTDAEKRTGIWYARNAVMAKTADNKFVIVSNEDNFSGSNSGFLYVALDDSKQSAKIGTNTYPSGKGMIELCGVDWDGTANGGSSEARYLNRFKFPNLIVDGNHNNLQTYVSYYEARQKQIQFFAFKTTATGPASNITYNCNLSEPIHDSKIAGNGNLALPDTAGGKSSEHTAMAKVGAGIYIAYHDADSGTLKLAYSKTPVDSSGLANTAVSAWKTLDVDTDPLTGQYVSMTASGTKLYIAYHDAASAALKLAVVETGSTVSVTSTVIVDAYQSVGYKTGITMAGGVPYISYYNNAQAGTKNSIKIAYPENAAAVTQAGAGTDGSFTGRWISMYVPSLSVPNVSIPEFNRTMIDTASGKPIMAWLGDPFIEYTRMK